MPKRFVIGTKGESGSIELHAMKPWLRLHPDQVPQASRLTTTIRINCEMA